MTAPKTRVVFARQFFVPPLHRGAARDENISCLRAGRRGEVASPWGGETPPLRIAIHAFAGKLLIPPIALGHHEG